MRLQRISTKAKVTTAMVPIAIVASAAACDPNVDYLAAGGGDATATDAPSAADLATDSRALDASGASSDALAVDAADGASACTPTAGADAIILTGLELNTSPSGEASYAYSFSDGVASTVCLSSTALCIAGQTAVARAPIVWGSGVGFSLNQGSSTQLNPYGVPTSADAIAYTLSNFPIQGARVTIDSGGAEYCSPLRSASGFATWNTFNTACWDGSGVTLSGPPQDATKIQFIVPAGSVAEPFDFCVESVSFISIPHPDASGDAALNSADASNDAALDSAFDNQGAD
jgi:hypothetical protein